MVKEDDEIEVEISQISIIILFIFDHARHRGTSRLFSSFDSLALLLVGTTGNTTHFVVDQLTKQIHHVSVCDWLEGFPFSAVELPI